MRYSKAMQFGALVALSLAFSQPRAQGEMHEKALDQYVLRSNAASSLAAPEGALADETLARTGKRGLIHIALVKKDGRLTESVPAQVQATAVNQFGSNRPISISENRESGRVFYTGAFVFAPGDILDFHIAAKPSGTEKVLEMTYREKFPGDRSRQ